MMGKVERAAVHLYLFRLQSFVLSCLSYVLARDAGARMLHLN
jgi:hypothetical protein